MDATTLKKDVRRDTVCIPMDDSTGASVFRDVFSPGNAQTLRSVSAQSIDGAEVGDLDARIARKQQTTKKSLGPARRAPLRPSTNIAQETSVRVDVVGRNGGKENIPPGYKCDSPTFERSKTKQQVARPGSVRPTVQIKTASTSSSSSRPVAARRANKPPQRTVLGDKGNATSTTQHISQKTNDVVKPERGRQQTLSKTQKPVLSKKHPKSSASPAVKAKKHNDESLLAEDIASPALGDNRLLHQEILITELLNGLFDQTNGQQTGSDYAVTLRYELLDRYQDNSFVLLYKRVQASLRYGALGIPKNILARGTRLQQDLGLKRKFLDLWMKTYDPRALKAALETVIGRRVVQHQDEGCLGKGLNKRLENFLEEFLLRNEDMQAQETSTTAHAYRRTVLRGIMVITLLDKARIHPNTTLPRCLFLASSSLKSSASVLQAFTRLLLPSSGDIIRSLGQLDGQVSYEQHQLGEYNYQIGNLAVDVRDGVRLTRMVELLLCPPLRHLRGEGLLSSNKKETGPLTPQLKLPCSSRAAKLFNVQVALNGISNKANGIAHDVAAVDIVDGHREKTIALLWKLVIRWGFAGSVDWDDVRREIARLKRRVVNQLGHEHVAHAWVAGITELGHRDDDHGDDEYTMMVKQWTALLAQLNGNRLDNTSTSFPDGCWIFECIVGEYQGYILGSMECRGNLALRLRALGCSPQFANLVTTTKSPHIDSNDLTLGALTILCSRLLSASKRARAATILQRTWREIFARRHDAYRRTIARVIARECAVVVQTRDRVLWAHDVIASRWRRYNGDSRKGR